MSTQTRVDTRPHHIYEVYPTSTRSYIKHLNLNLTLLKRNSQLVGLRQDKNSPDFTKKRKRRKVFKLIFSNLFNAPIFVLLFCTLQLGCHLDVNLGVCTFIVTQWQPGYARCVLMSSLHCTGNVTEYARCLLYSVQSSL